MHNFLQSLIFLCFFLLQKQVLRLHLTACLSKIKPHHFISLSSQEHSRKNAHPAADSHSIIIFVVVVVSWETAAAAAADLFTKAKRSREHTGEQEEEIT